VLIFLYQHEVSLLLLPQCEVLSQQTQPSQKPEQPQIHSDVRFASVLLLLVWLLPLTVSAETFSSLNAFSEEELSSSTPRENESVFTQDVPTLDEAAKYRQFVHGASKSTQQATRAPASITLVTADEIKKYGYRTLADILQSVNGFYVTNDRNYTYLGVRGFGRPADYNTRILLLVDGYRLNDNLYDQAFITSDGAIDIDLIERVEIIRGPGSSLYGTNAFLGVINIVTKRGRDIKGVEVSTELGSYHSYKGRFTYGQLFPNGLDFLLSGSLTDSAGHSRLYFKEFDAPKTNNGIVRNADSEQGYTLFTKLSLAKFTLQGSYTHRKKQVPTASFETVFNSKRTHTRDEHGYVSLLYEHELARQLGVRVRLHYGRYYYQGDYLLDSSTEETPALVLNKDYGLGETWGSEVSVTKRLGEKHKVIVGGEYRDNFTLEQRNIDQHPFASHLNDKRSSKVWALYFQDEFSIRDNLTFNAGFRYDHYSSFGGTLNPRLALIYTLKQTSLKLLYGHAFRAPNAFEQFYADNITNKANPDLKPEIIKTYEIMVEQYLNRNLRAAISGYYYTISGLIDQTSDSKDGLLIYKNIDSVEAKGLEFELNGKWESGLEGRISYAVQKAVDQKTGRRLTNSAQHMVKTSLLIPLWRDKVFAGIETRYMSSRRTLAGHASGDLFVTNLTLFSQHLLKGVELSGSIYNLFDDHYDDPGAGEHRQDLIPQDGRTFWIRLKYHFPI
jgi:outer membrane receptor for ferrienterochelin and colicins